MKKVIFTLALVALGLNATAQFRANDKTGLHVFENTKTDVKFEKVKTTIGGGFTQSFQALNHSNTAVANVVSGVDQNKLNSIVPGFNLASANLQLKTLLADGIALNMELYLSARHHNETWVKGGFIQFDKLAFLKSDMIDDVMKYTTIKVGQMGVNYGDAHFRRTDGGNAIYNPFVENYIVDAFATELGTEIDVNYNNIVGVVGVTTGKLNSDINEPVVTVGANETGHNPAFLAKLGYDKQFNDDLRVRLTGSTYYTAGSYKNTLYWGDRTGSNYFGVMDYQKPSTATAWTGRYNVGFSDKVAAVMGNLFIKYKGLESFTTFENASGRKANEITGDRAMTQIATDLIYRFGKCEDFWVGARYNTMTTAYDATTDITINRLALSAGWFVTKNVMAKAEYVTQDYQNFPTSNILSGGNFNGLVVNAVIGF